MGKRADRAGPHSGYEVKQLVDHSARFFWAASYGQIYPELRRLEAAGLVTAKDDPAARRWFEHTYLPRLSRAQTRIDVGQASGCPQLRQPCLEQRIAGGPSEIENRHCS